MLAKPLQAVFYNTFSFFKALKDEEGRLTVEKSEIADILNNHLESIFIKEPSDPLSEFEKRISVNFGAERVLQRSISLR